MSKWLLISLTLLLAACAENGEDINEDYETRLSSIVGEPPTLQRLKTTAVPDIRLPSSKHQISILELGSLSHCKLSGLIANKNNQLGKTQLPSEHLKYQIKFIQLVSECLNQANTTDATLKQVLMSAAQNKRENLLADFYYMLFTESELKQLLQLTSDYLPVDTKKYSFYSAYEALNTLSAIKQNIEQDNIAKIDTTELTLALEKLNKNQFTRRLITSAKLQILYNNHLTDWLNDFNFTQAVCREGKNKKNAQVLNTIFNKYYLSTIQTYQADITGHLEKVSPVLFHLWQGYSQVNHLVNVNSPDSLLMRLKNSSRAHVVWWQNFYKLCNISPI